MKLHPSVYAATGRWSWGLLCAKTNGYSIEGSLKTFGPTIRLSASRSSALFGRSASLAPDLVFFERFSVMSHKFMLPTTLFLGSFSCCQVWFTCQKYTNSRTYTTHCQSYFYLPQSMHAKKQQRTKIVAFDKVLPFCVFSKLS